MVKVTYYPNASRKCEATVKELVKSLAKYEDTIAAVDVLMEGMPKILDAETMAAATRFYSLEYEDNGCDLKLYYQETDLVAEILEQ